MLFSIYYTRGNITSSLVQRKCIPDRQLSLFTLEADIAMKSIAVAETDSTPVVERVSSNKKDIVDQGGGGKVALEKRSKHTRCKNTRSQHTSVFVFCETASRCLTEPNVRSLSFVQYRIVAHNFSMSTTYKQAFQKATLNFSRFPPSHCPPSLGVENHPSIYFIRNFYILKHSHQPEFLCNLTVSRPNLAHDSNIRNCFSCKSANESSKDLR